MPYSTEAPVLRPPVRLTVGTDRGPRSAVWRIWSQGDETYVAPRRVRDKKASLHSGAHFYHGDRPFYRWGRPRPFGPDATNLYQIWIPTPELTTPKVEPPEAEKADVVLVPPAPADLVTVISIVQTGAMTDLGPPPEMPSGLLAHWPLRSGAQIWVVGTYQPYLDDNKEMVARGKAEGWEYEGPGLTEFVEAEGDIRMILWVNEDGERYGIVDVSSRREGSDPSGIG